MYMYIYINMYYICMSIYIYIYIQIYRYMFYLPDFLKFFLHDGWSLFYWQNYYLVLTALHYASTHFTHFLASRESTE